jgi:long-chain acyl-CoA synthetase
MSEKTPWPKYRKTIPEMFYGMVSRYPGETVFRHKKEGAWRDVTWKETEDNVLAIASGLLAEGLEMGSAVAILSGNRKEWVYADLGVLSAGVKNVPIYPTNTADQVGYILEDSGSEMVFVENRSQLDKVLKVKKDLPKLRRAIVIEPHAEQDEFVTDLAALMKKGKASLDRAAIEKRWKAVDPEDVATLIYTSGTTGNPKGVMLCHRNLVSNIQGIRDFLSIQPGTRDLQFLPICHSFGRMEVLGFMMYRGVVTFAESIEKIPDNLKEVKPQVFITVPRLLEKVHAKIMSGVESGSNVKKTLFAWALGVGGKVSRAKMEKRPVPLALAVQFRVAEKLVFSKIQAALGGELEYLVYGAAPLASEIEEFFAAAGISILGAYGLTETSPGLTGNLPNDYRLGTVGKPWSDTEIRIAADGEILARGPQIMKGYWNKPEATREVLDEEGWFYTGDIGVVDSDGFLKITDRKKDLIITAGGKNVAPQNIENFLKMDEAVEQLAVIGDRRKYLVALIVPNFQWLEAFAKEKGITGSRVELIASPVVKQEYERRIAEKNKNLAKYETIKSFELLSEEFSVENNMFTPTMKVRRKNVMQIYNDLIESMYTKE